MTLTILRVGQRHNLDVITVLTPDARITDDYPKYAGMDRYEAREAIVKDLDEGGFLYQDRRLFA